MSFRDQTVQLAVAGEAAASPGSLDLLVTPGWITVGALSLAPIFVATVALPLATYTTVLALFGLAHVGSELRYIDYRFGARLRGGFGAWIGASLALAVAARLSALLGFMPAAFAVPLEVAFGAGMAGICVAQMRRHRAIAVVIAVALFCGAVLAPFETLLVLAIAHNLTPLAFLADALSGARRRRVLTLLALPFVVLPLLIATGLPYRLLQLAGLVAPEATLFAAGSLEANLGAYVPADLAYSDFALQFFSAAVFAQCMHYAVVIGLLPRLIDANDPTNPPMLPWPRAARFACYLGGVAALLTLGFGIDYQHARQIYALAAMVHSWIEIPILVLALDRSPRLARQIRSSA
jgi:hypothetical protein